MARDITFGIRLKADGSGFVGEVKIAGDAVERFGKQTAKAAKETERGTKDLEGSLRRAATVGTLLGNVIADVVRGIANAVPNAIEDIDNLAKTAQGLGLGAVAFSEYATGARLAGVTSAQFEGGIARLNQRLTDAANGGRESAEIFRLMGIRVTESNGRVRDTEAVLREVAERFAGYRDDAAQGTLAAELFGRQAGPRMAAYLNQSAEALRVNSGLTEDLVRQAQAAQGAIEALGVEFSKLRNAVLAEALPPLTQFVTELVAARQATGSWFKALQAITATRTLEEVAEQLQTVSFALSQRPDDTGLQERLQYLQAQYDVLAARARRAADESLRVFVAGRNAITALEPGRGPMGLQEAPRTSTGTSGRAARAERDDFEQLNRTIRERIALMEAEEAAGRSLTSAEQLRVKVLGDLAAGELNLKTGTEAALRAELDRYVAIERGAIARREAEAAIQRANESSARELAAIVSETDRIREANRTRGLARSTIIELDLARQEALLTQQLAEDADEREIAHTRQLIAEKKRLLAQVKLAERLDLADEAAAQAKAAQDAITELDQFALQAARNIQSYLGDTLFDLMQGNFDNIGDAFKRMIDRMVAEAAAAQLGKYLFGDFGSSGKIGGGVGSLFTEIAGGAGSSGAFDWIGNAFIGAFGLHRGGVAGREATFVRPVPARTVLGARRLHGGGMAGLLAGEVPAILQQGEEVLTRRDPRHRDNGGRGRPVVQNFYFQDTRPTRQTQSQLAAAAERGLGLAGARMN